eukprot:scaffold6143_cov147-Skeletonema_dohrnii-CCMP3373.AAC.1
MNTSPTTTGLPAANETGTEIVSPTGSELSLISLDADPEQASDDASFVVVGASPKAKMMKEVLLSELNSLPLSIISATPYEAKGEEIIPVTDTGTLLPDAEDSPNILVDAPSTQATSWTKVLIGIGALCATGGVSYFLAGSGSIASSKTGGVSHFLAGSGSIASSNMKMMNLQTDAIKKGGYTFTLFADEAFCGDEDEAFYPFVQYPASSAEECGELCSKCPGNGQKDLVLRGFDYIGSNSICLCLVDSGISFDKTVCEDEGATDDNSLLPGSGEVMTRKPSDPFDGEQCWKGSSKGSKAKAAKTKSSKQPIRRKLGQQNSQKISISISSLDHYFNNTICTNRRALSLLEWPPQAQGAIEEGSRLRNKNNALLILQCRP